MSSTKQQKLHVVGSREERIRVAVAAEAEEYGLTVEDLMADEEIMNLIAKKIDLEMAAEER